MRYAHFCWLFLFSLLSCAQDFGGPASLCIRFSLQAGQRTLVPDIDTTLASFRVQGKGPPGASFDMTVSSSVLQLDSLVPGSWDISVSGHNKAGILISEGSASLVLSTGMTTFHTLLLCPARGRGTMEITLVWGEGTIADPRVNGKLTDLAGVETVPEVVLSPGQATISAADVETGYHVLAVTLKDGDLFQRGYTWAVQILKDTVTKAVIDTNSGLPKTASTFAFSQDTCPPLELGIGALDTHVFRGMVVRPLADISDAEQTSAFTWYVNGLAAGFGREIAFDTASCPSLTRVDLVVSSQDAARAGSFGKFLNIVDPVFHGTIAFLKAFLDNNGGVDGLEGARCVILTGQEERLIVAGYTENEVGVFCYDSYGILGFKERLGQSVLLNGVSNLCALPGSTDFFVAATKGNSVTLFREQSSRYVPLFTIGNEVDCDLLAPKGLAVSPDGKFLYVSGSGSGTIIVCSVDILPPSLSLKQTIKGEGALASLLIAPEALALSPDGEYLYACDYGSDSVLVFSRNGIEGTLSFVSSVKDGESGIETLNGPTALAVTGRQVYVTSYYDHALTVFSRNSADGTLSLIEVHKNGLNGFQGLRYAQGVAISPDGKEMYAAGGGDDSLCVFSRDAAAGRLLFVSRAVEGVAGVYGLDSPRSIAVSPDCCSVFVASANSNALGVFRRK